MLGRVLQYVRFVCLFFVCSLRECLVDEDEEGIHHGGEPTLYRRPEVSWRGKAPSLGIELCCCLRAKRVA